MLDMNNKKVVIFGGGQVGARKAVLFSRYAHTTVISRSFTPVLHELGEVSLVKTSGIMSDIEISDFVRDAFIVIPTTSDLELNRRITDIAHQHHCLVNTVDGIEDLAVPSLIERGDITIAISTGGASPALTKYLRKKIEETITSEYGDMARLLKEIRPKLKQQVARQADRSSILWAILEDEDIWRSLGESYDRAMDAALNHIFDVNNKLI